MIVLPRLPSVPLVAARILAAVAAVLLVLAVTPPAHATKIERVVTPRGLEVWLVRAPSVPLVALDFAFRGGSAQDPTDRPGLASMVASLMDEGAGDLDAEAFHERLESKAIEFSVSAHRDTMNGSLRTLTEHRDEAFRLLGLAMTRTRFDAEAIERMRADILAALSRDEKSTNDLASRRWWETAFSGHPYAHKVRGTAASVASITKADLEAYARRVFARDNLKIGVVGNVDPETVARLVDEAFGALPAKADLAPVPAAVPADLGGKVVAAIDMAQSSILVGGPGLARSDPDYITAHVVNHVLGGGSFSSRLYREVREERGLAYSVGSYLSPMRSAALWFVSTGTRQDRVGDTLGVIGESIRRMSEEGPTAEELAQAKSYLIGSYALGFDTSGKIANQLVQIQLENLGIDYVDRRNALVAAVTLEDAKRVAKRLYGGKSLTAIAGRPNAEAAPPAAAPTR